MFLEGSHMGESVLDSSVWTHPGLHSQSSRAELLLFLSRCSLLHVLCVAVLLRAARGGGGWVLRGVTMFSVLTAPE